MNSGNGRNGLQLASFQTLLRQLVYKTLFRITLVYICIVSNTER